MSYQFHLPTNIIYGAGSLNQLGESAKIYGKKALIACDPFSVECGLVGRAKDILAKAGIDSVLFSEVIPNPTCTLIDKGAALAVKEGCQFTIGIGGGSSMDAAKGIAVSATHGGTIWPYAIGEKPIENKVLPIVAISTTSGTGSQCTMFSVITNPKTNQKPGMGSPYIIPSLAIVDAELTASMPVGLTICTGFDAFTHAVEAYTSKISSPLSDLYSEKAIALIVKYLRRAVENGKDIEAREGMGLADTCAGIAINHAVVSLAHVMAHVIGGHYHDIAHGDALYTIYRETLRVNSVGEKEKHSWIANQLKPGCNDIVAAFDSFFGGMKFTNKLKTKSPDKAKMRQIAEETFTYMKGCADLNPVEANADIAMRILENSLS